MSFFFCNDQTLFMLAYKTFIFSSLYSANDPIWLTKGVPYHLLHVLAKLLEKFGDSPSAVSNSER